MDLQFFDSDEVPVPREEVRLRGLVARPLPGRTRVRVEVEITPFQERPNLDLALLDPRGDTVSRSTIVEADSPRLSVTLHLRSAPQPGKYSLRGDLSYQDAPAQDSRQVTFSLEEAEGLPPAAR